MTDVPACTGFSWRPRSRLSAPGAASQPAAHGVSGPHLGDPAEQVERPVELPGAGHQVGARGDRAGVRGAVDGDKRQRVPRGGRQLIQGRVGGPQRWVAPDRVRDVLGGVRQLAVVECEPGQRELSLGFRTSLADALRHAPPPSRSADTIAPEAGAAGRMRARPPDFLAESSGPRWT